MQRAARYVRAIREQDPLKQGLKHEHRPVCTKEYHIREQDPLKQGLKHITNRCYILDNRFVSKIH